MKFIKAEKLKEKPADQSKLGFGKIFTDYMLTMKYRGGKWEEPVIEPYGPVAFDLATTVFHYAQGIFEGLKAFRNEKGEVRVFRPEENFRRMNRSAERMCIPPIDEKVVLDGLFELLKIEKDWIPTAPGTSLYIRPFIIAVDPHVGVHPAHHLLFIIILSPVGAYYPEGINPVRIYVERKYVRAVRGGMGYVKTAGNYAASPKAQEVAEAEGYTQVLWLDGVERKYIEEVGTMNVFFKIGGEIITPELQGSILGGITRMSSIELLRSWGYTVTERRLALDEVVAAAKNGTLDEAFGTGTAAVISPIGELKVDDDKIVINDGKIGDVAQRLYTTLTDIQNGRTADPFGWVVPVE